MNLSMKWLADYVDCGVSVKEFCAGMTMSGSKVETYETEGDAVKNVIVGKLVSITPHENSDHLQVCQVDVGGDAPIQIVTGAQNIVEGALVPVAMIGADLPGGVHIKKGKLRGVQPSGLPVGSRSGERGCRNFRQAPESESTGIPRFRGQAERQPGCGSGKYTALPSLYCRHGKEREDRSVSPLDAGTSPCQRRASHQQPGGAPAFSGNANHCRRRKAYRCCRCYGRRIQRHHGRHQYRYFRVRLL